MKKEYLLLILIVSVSIFLSAAGLIGTLDVYADYDHDIIKQPALSLVMRGIHDGISPFGKGPETDVDTDAEDASEKDHDDDPCRHAAQYPGRDGGGRRIRGTSFRIC